VTLAVDEKTLPMATITGRTDRRTDRQTDRVRRNMRPPPREEGRLKSTQRDANTARAGCSNVRTPPASAVTNPQTGPITIHCAARSV